MKAIVYSHEGTSLTVYNPKNIEYTNEATIHGKVHTLVCEVDMQRSLRKGDLYLRKGLMSEKVNIAQRQIIQAWESAILKGDIIVPASDTPEHEVFQKLMNNTIVSDGAQLANKMGDLIVVDTW